MEGHNYSTLTTDQRIQVTLMQNLLENVHTVREEEATWSGRSGHYKEWWDTFCTSLKCPSGVCAHPNTVGLNGWPLMNTKGHMHTVHYQKHARNCHNIIKNYFIHVID